MTEGGAGTGIITPVNYAIRQTPIKEAAIATVRSFIYYSYH